MQEKIIGREQTLFNEAEGPKSLLQEVSGFSVLTMLFSVFKETVPPSGDAEESGPFPDRDAFPPSRPTNKIAHLD